MARFPATAEDPRKGIIIRRDFPKLCGLGGLGFAAPTGKSMFAADAKKEPPHDGINEINRLYKDGDILMKGQHMFAPTAKTNNDGMSNEIFVPNSATNCSF